MLFFTIPVTIIKCVEGKEEPKFETLKILHPACFVCKNKKDYSFSLSTDVVYRVLEIDDHLDDSDDSDNLNDLDSL